MLRIKKAVKNHVIRTANLRWSKRIRDPRRRRGRRPRATSDLTVRPRIVWRLLGLYLVLLAVSYFYQRLIRSK